ncbi:eukaryotic translation initiation factor 4E [Gonapodya prolifera JEL478]|uniref:Eukaryotic translation initiation factor 4E n=1 Tax=Gonapodya prolifera (strain JEL478) TaxID=1344416 RepID=A0A139AW65_GONPJ|nr:eukaryotic translation initiation factor 4E [Gonapodya prolifera JEL478]|eukprot:KXS20968.1 eukaryotic translation initiation factor 4E [Gonapodya prolifera JEL478]
MAASVDKSSTNPTSHTTPSSPSSTSSGPHPLRHAWTFWYLYRTPGAKPGPDSYNPTKLASFDTVEGFAAIFAHLKRPGDERGVSDVHLFREGVSPMWEDDFNKQGGKWIVRLRKGLVQRYWENLLFALVGNQIDFAQQISGVVVSVRQYEDILSLWTTNSEAARVNLRIKDGLRKVLDLPPETAIEYKAHQDAIADKHSYRNADVFR